MTVEATSCDSVFWVVLKTSVSGEISLVSNNALKSLLGWRLSNKEEHSEQSAMCALQAEFVFRQVDREAELLKILQARSRRL